MAWLQILGIGFEAVGLLVALYGLRVRFRDFAPAGRGAFDPAIQSVERAARKTLRSLIARVRRILGRRQNVVAHAGVVRLTGGGSFRARGRVGFGPLPTARSNKPALAELDRRTRDLMERVSDVRDTLEDESARIDGDVAAVREELQAQAERLQDQIRRLATGDVGLQYVGFAMIGLGLVLQGIGAALPG